jgi:hypothetical protein
LERRRERLGMSNYDWNYKAGNAGVFAFQCGFCGRKVSAGLYLNGTTTALKLGHRIVIICTHCERPSYFEIMPGKNFEDAKVLPAPKFGEDVDNLEGDIASAYDEARNCLQVEAYTAAVMTCRVILSRIAVDQGAAENLSFRDYVTYLQDNHHTPKGSKIWVDQIRKMGNEANHELRIFSYEEAKEILEFTSMLLRLNYDYPKRMEAKTATPL